MLDDARIPDFTIQCADGKTLCWEHVGMLGVEEYDEAWNEKIKIYHDYFPDIILENNPIQNHL